MNGILPIDTKLPAGSAGKLSTSFWGVWTLIVTEGSLFGYLLVSYFYLFFQSGQHWPPEGHPSLVMPGINTVLLLTSSVFAYLSERSLRRKRRCAGLMAVAIALGIAFVTVQLREWSHKTYGISTHLYGSLYFTVTGFHMAHVVIGLVILSLLMLWTVLGLVDEKRHMPVTIGGLYWHFVDAVWLVIFTSFYLVPYLPGR